MKRVKSHKDKYGLRHAIFYSILGLIIAVGGVVLIIHGVSLEIDDAIPSVVIGLMCLFIGIIIIDVELGPEWLDRFLTKIFGEPGIYME